MLLASCCHSNDSNKYGSIPDSDSLFSVILTTQLTFIFFLFRLILTVLSLATRFTTQVPLCTRHSRLGHSHIVNISRIEIGGT
jgi:hypothetical protein